MRAVRVTLAVALVALAAMAAGLASGCQGRTPALDQPREFEAKLQQLVGLRRFGSADSLINARARLRPGDPEVAVARGNLYYQMAVRAARNQAPGLPGAAADSGGPRGPDTLLVRRSIEALREGIAQHPERLDIRFGLAYIEQELGATGTEIEVLRDAIRWAKQHPDDLRWRYGDPLPSPPGEYVPQALHDYVSFYLDRGAPGDEVPMLAIARMSAEAYPSNNRSTNDVAFYYGARGDWKRSLEFLERAERADSSDALVLFNLGWAHENLGHRAPALRYYSRAVTAGDAGRMKDIAQSARQRLAALRGNAPLASAPPPFGSRLAPASRPATSRPSPSRAPSEGVQLPVPPAPLDTIPRPIPQTSP